MITISQIKSKIRHEITLKGIVVAEQHRDQLRAHTQISDRISDKIYDNACHQVFEIIYHEVRRNVNFETLYYF